MPSPSAEPNTTDWHQSKVTAEFSYCSFKHETSVKATIPVVLWEAKRGKKEASALCICSLSPASIHVSFNTPHELTDQSSSWSKSLFPQFSTVEFPTEVLPKTNLPNIRMLFKMGNVWNYQSNVKSFSIQLIHQHLFWCCSGLKDSFRPLTSGPDEL